MRGELGLALLLAVGFFALLNALRSLGDGQRNCDLDSRNFTFTMQVSHRIADGVVSKKCFLTDDGPWNNANDVVLWHDKFLSCPLSFKCGSRVVHVQNPDLPRTFTYAHCCVENQSATSRCSAAQMKPELDKSAAWVGEL